MDMLRRNARAVSGVIRRKKLREHRRLWQRHITILATLAQAHMQPQFLPVDVARLNVQRLIQTQPAQIDQAQRSEKAQLSNL